MSNTWIKPGLCALLALAFLAVPARAVGPEEEPKTDSEKITAILKKLNTLQAAVEGRLSNAEQNITQLRDEITLLKTEVQRLASEMARANARIARSFSPAEPAQGTIRIQNRSAYTATVILNGNSTQVVPPGQTREVRNVPAGGFTYEVYAEGFGLIQPAKATTLNARELYTIYVNP
jgi:hypothetical protein